MNYDAIRNEIAVGAGVSESTCFGIFDAFAQIYPMILLANLTKNSYVLLSDNGFLYHKLEKCGNYDIMISDGVRDIHPSCQDAFIDAYDRQSLLHRYASGINTVVVKLYQKNPDGDYQWVQVKVIRLVDESGDVVQICLNEVMRQ